MSLLESIIYTCCSFYQDRTKTTVSENTYLRIHYSIEPVLSSLLWIPEIKISAACWDCVLTPFTVQLKGSDLITIIDNKTQGKEIEHLKTKSSLILTSQSK